MSSYLIYSDFKKLIQADNLQQIIGYDMNVLDGITQAAIVEATSYLIQKYDTSAEFTPTYKWDKTVAYKRRERVYLDATAYSATSLYALTDLCLQGGNVYSCSTAITVIEAFTIGHWALLGAQYDIFYVKLPYPEFNYKEVYATGDKVWWKDKVYTALRATAYPSHEQIISNPGGELIYNEFPGEAGTTQWNSGDTYSPVAGTLPTDTAKWIKGDNRNQQLVNYIIDIALYTAHSRIAPRNIPDLRVKRYDDAKEWLKGAAQGKYITAAIERIQPNEGKRIIYGGNNKLKNSY